ncbi:GntR family transcriptional regulator [Cupriavidus sp. PET2-C1]
MQRCSEIVARLREDIRTGKLPIGTVLRQDALSKRFQSSRMPVREALLVLAAE